LHIEKILCCLLFEIDLQTLLPPFLRLSSGLKGTCVSFVLLKISVFLFDQWCSETRCLAGALKMLNVYFNKRYKDKLVYKIN